MMYLPRNDRDKEKEGNHVIPVLQKVCRVGKGIRELATRSRRPRPFRKSLEIAVNEPAIRHAWKINDRRPPLDLSTASFFAYLSPFNLSHKSLKILQQR